jgi:diguanylate cyclase (GGDEF)-like protein
VRRSPTDDTRAFAFGLRMFGAIAAAFLLVGVIGFTLIDRKLEERLLDTYGQEQKAQAKSFEEVDARTATEGTLLREIEEVMESLADSPGTVEVLLIDQFRRIEVDGNGTRAGQHSTDPRIEAALVHDRPYAGRASDPEANGDDFEFITPVDLGGKRYAFAIRRDSSFLDSQLADLRETLFLIGALALVLGSLAFYLVGGRSLMRSHRRVLERATRDGLADLPNQRAFQEEFPHAVTSSRRHGEPLSLAVLDIDDFKFINDRHGHPHGDSLIRQVADVLRRGRSADRAYRVGGDEFAVLLPGCDAEAATTLTRRLSRSFAEARVGVSIGVGELCPGQEATDLRAEADAALYEAKRRGGNRALHFRDVQDDVVFASADKMLAVRTLLEERRLKTLFQPIWNLADGTLIGVEALTRPDPSYGLNGPSEAFDIADRIGRIHDLDRLCVETALSSAPALPEGALLFLNVSPRTLDLDADDDGWLRQAVEAAGMDPTSVVIEVTERFGGRTGSVVKSLLRLREAGFKLALDDVGTGNAGLEMLRRVDAQFVKLDSGIVTAAPTEPAARAVLVAMAAFAHQTGAFVIAEGIEDDELLEFVSSVDDRDLAPAALIQGGQGYGLGMPAADLPREVRLHAARHHGLATVAGA